MLSLNQANGVKRQYEGYLLNARKLVKRNPMVKKARAIKDQAQSQGVAIGDKVEELISDQCHELIHRPTLGEITEIARREGKSVNQTIGEMGFLSDKLEIDHQALEFIVQEAHEQHQTVAEKVVELANEPIKEDSGREALEVRDDIGKESEQLAQIVDVIDELNIINLILEEQYEMARWSMSHKDVKDFVRDVRPSFRALLEESERVRRSVSAISILSPTNGRIWLG
jgi:hypothetical protein